MDEKKAVTSDQVRRTVERLLSDADRAIAADRLTTPLEDNALDRYRAVLALQPDNMRAKLGLNDIVERYLIWARTNIEGGELTRAGLNLTRALAVEPGNERVLALAAEVRQRANQVIKDVPQQARDNEWLLDKARLDVKHERLVAELQVLAERLKLSGETMLIVARNDSEGRWIYKMMRQAVPGYRLRGNITLGRIPKIVIQPPI